VLKFVTYLSRFIYGLPLCDSKELIEAKNFKVNSNIKHCHIYNKNSDMICMSCGESVCVNCCNQNSMILMGDKIKKYKIDNISLSG